MKIDAYEPNTLYLSYEQFDSITKKIVEKLNSKSSEIELFNEDYEDIVFVFLLWYSPESFDIYYSPILQQIENIIELCILAYNDIIQTKFNSIDDMFEQIYKINSLKNKGKEIAKYINDGKYYNKSERDILRLAKIIDRLNIKSYLDDLPENKNNWDYLFEISNDDLF